MLSDNVSFRQNYKFDDNLQVFDKMFFLSIFDKHHNNVIKNRGRWKKIESCSAFIIYIVVYIIRYITGVYVLEGWAFILIDDTNSYITGSHFCRKTD